MDFNVLALDCAPWVSVQTLTAIVRTESGFKPLSIGVNGGAHLQRQPLTKEEAVVTSKWLIERGYNIDMGLGQVNSANLNKMRLSVEDMFDPCKNLAVSASILKSNYLLASRYYLEDQDALHAALSAYNTGSFNKGIANGYVQKVINNAPGSAGKVIPLVKDGVASVRRVGKGRAVAKGKNSDGDLHENALAESGQDAANQNIMVYQ